METVLVSALVFFTLAPLAALGSSFFYVDNQGNVGIGNSSPQAKLDVSGAMFSELITDIDSSSVTVDWSTGNVHKLVLNTGNTTLTFSNGQAGGKYDVIVKQDTTGGRTVTWPSNVEWVNGSAPTLSSAASSTDLAHFIYDGTNYLGTYALNYGAAVIARDADSTVTDAGAGSATASASVTTGAHSTLLLALVHDQSGAGCGNVTGVTANGASMTQWATFHDTGGGGNRCSLIYALVNPSPNTSYTVTASRTNTSFDLLEQAIAYSGTSVSNSPDATASGYTAVPTQPSVTLTTVAASAWSVGIGRGPTALGGSTNCTSLGTGQDVLFCDSNGSLGAAGNKTVAFTSNGGGGGLLTVSIAP